MHRVELKAFLLACWDWVGVSFLMHRVELKVQEYHHPQATFSLRFLMHRVELKEISVYPLQCDSIVVPNAPCGVERTKCVAKI